MVADLPFQTVFVLLICLRSVYDFVISRSHCEVCTTYGYLWCITRRPCNSLFKCFLPTNLKTYILRRFSSVSTIGFLDLPLFLWKKPIVTGPSEIHFDGNEGNASESSELDVSVLTGWPLWNSKCFSRVLYLFPMTSCDNSKAFGNVPPVDLKACTPFSTDPVGV